MKFLALIFFTSLLTVKTFGQSWTLLNSGTTTSLYSMYFMNDTVGWAAGNNGMLVSTTDGGDSWSTQNIGNWEHLWEVFFVTEQTGWVSGSNGTIMRSDDGGVTWAFQTSGVTETLWGLFMVSELVGYASGAGGTILKTLDGGQNWLPQVSGVWSTLWNPFFLNPDTGWVTGGGGIILFTTDGGANWAGQSTPTNQTVWSAYFVDDVTGWAFCNGGVIMHTSDAGATWNLQNSGVTQFIHWGYMTDHQNGWGVGESGTIVATTDGGQNWFAETSPVSNHLRSCYFTPDGTGFIAGEGGRILRRIAPGCSTPSGIVTFNITPNSARLNWTMDVSAFRYEVQGGVVGHPNFKSINIPTNSPGFINVYGLSNQTYWWQIRAFCDAQGNSESGWSASDTFSTGCFTPENLYTSNIQATGTILNWTPVNGAAGYEIRGGSAGGPYINVLIGGGNTSSKQVFGLNPNTTYEWKIRTWCDAGGSAKSAYSEFLQFTTHLAFAKLAGPGNQVSDALKDPTEEAINSFSIRPNPTVQFFRIDFSVPSHSEGLLEIVDVSGISRKQVRLQKGIQAIMFDTEDLPSGFYLCLLFVNGKKVKVKKLVVEGG